ncbi:uncharacterized protein DUF4301 [Breznakibacter xylanolyticus]|uniref:Uncharacterized protein DUF4301 n=1 Tax=Breznakibacter xylanolyticus TaxID=990 RepID=A0A2W7N6M7_9BACT|nr:DUF4301 family protein [Breznakibacter xylanolyticus]PZX15363.1 uncharacterized protein DUF4301 [Breznakibacter xylanolyticus]
MLSVNDQLQLEQKGITIEKIEMQLSHFKDGFPFMNIVKAATVDNGILRVDTNATQHAVQMFDDEVKNGLSITKFVPASGAATRMFKALFDYLNKLSDEAPAEMPKPVAEFIERLPDFPFFDELEKCMGMDLKKLSVRKDNAEEILSTFLLNTGMNYGGLPKGVLKFHGQGKQARTPIEEHLLEAALYGRDARGKAKLHFTVSPEHEALFQQITDAKKGEYEKRFDVSIEVSFSHQKTATDTLAVTPDNQPFRTDSGDLLFRPAGHGALIENLNDLDSDLIFIKNIDNVVPEHRVAETVTYKKVLAGTLCRMRKKVFEVLSNLDQLELKTIRTQIIPQLEKDLLLQLPDIVKNADDVHLKKQLHTYLNRPMRVCGMVRNLGEPGGGPFWVMNGDNSLSLQIVESSQIDLSNAARKAVFDGSSHFNPVDLVCAVKNYRGEKFNLLLYVDPDTGFISEKSQNGRPLKALELPGLWNGAMAHWLTMFVEVPLTTFNPVKTINDLLRAEHQPVKS